MKLTNRFLRGYCDAALFTTDEHVPGGCDYVECGRADEMFPNLPDDWQNGTDFWYTRNHHGVGFWDRDYPDEVADPLTEAAQKFGQHDLYPDEIGQTEEAQ